MKHLGHLMLKVDLNQDAMCYNRGSKTVCVPRERLKGTRP